MTTYPMDTLSPDLYPIIFHKSSTPEMMSYRLVNHNGDKIVCTILMKHLPFICTNKITDGQLVIFKHARTIDLRLCRQISDAGLRNLKSVRILNLRGCHKITDVGLRRIQTVTALNITGCNLITSEGLRLLDKLTYLDASYLDPHVYREMQKFIIVITEKHEIDNTYPILSNKDNINILKIPLVKKKNTKCNNQTSVVQINPKMIDDSKNNSSALSDLRNRLNLFNKIYDEKLQVSDQADLIGNYRELLPHKKLNSKKKALSNLYSINPYIRTFVNKIKAAGLDVLIVGSAALYCVWADACFMPNDLDIYINNMQVGDMQILEDVLYQTFDIAHFSVVQNHLTTTFLVQVFSGEIYSIQLNMFNIKSWAQIFVIYHSNITCIGYEILTNRFLYMRERFNNLLGKDVQFFSNILNFDNKDTLSDATYKYAGRGFNCVHIDLSTGNEYRKNQDMIVSLLSYYYNFSHNLSGPRYNKYSQHNPPYFIDTLQNSLDYNCEISSTSATFCRKILPIVYISVYIISKHVINNSEYIDMETVREYFKFEDCEYTQLQNRIFKQCNCGKYYPFNGGCKCRTGTKKIMKPTIFII